MRVQTEDSYCVLGEGLCNQKGDLFAPRVFLTVAHSYCVLGEGLCNQKGDLFAPRVFLTVAQPAPKI